MGDRPLAIDLFTGLHGWSEGLVAEGYRVVGFDIEDMCGQFGQKRPDHVSLVIQDVLTLHGSQFKDAALIVASPPCQAYSWMAMPWKLAKAKAAAIRADTTGQSLADLNRLFNACFRIQKEASIAAGRHIPMVIENVRGAQPWVGRARYNFGSFYLWGDVPALMPMTVKATKVPGFRFDGSGKTFQSASVAEHSDATKVPSADGGRRTDKGKGARFTSRDCGIEGRKMPGIELSEVGFNVAAARQYAHLVEGAEYVRTADDKRQHIGINRKMASAMIAKIPLPLSRHIAATYRET